MKKELLFIVLISCFFSSSTFTQDYRIMVRPIKSANWGYADINGEVVIEPRFRRLSGFSEDGYAVVYRPKKFYFINKYGEILVPKVEKYKVKQVLGFFINGFSNGLIPLSIKGKWGYMNTNGEIAIDPIYDKVVSFVDGFAIAKRNESFFILNVKGKEKTINIEGLSDVKYISEGMAPYKIDEVGYGFINLEGEIVIPVQFTSVGYFNNGLARVKDKSGKHGYIDMQGNWIVEPQYLAAKDFGLESGLARVKGEDNFWKYIDKTGKVIPTIDTEVYGDFVEGLAIGRKLGKHGFFNANMEWAIPPKFDGVRDFNDGYAAAKEGHLWGIIDKSGNWVIEPKFEAIKDVYKINK